MNRIGAVLLLVLISCGRNERQLPPGDGIKIEWTDNLSGDFSFKDSWSYPEGVYINAHGQLSCDGLCPPETDAMKDANGKIYPDSLAAFYSVVDTSHLYHSLRSEAAVHEWAGTHFISVKRAGKDTVICTTQNNAATHSSLHIILAGNRAVPVIRLTSISRTPEEIIPYKAGRMQIDAPMWRKGILKASFDFTFDVEGGMYWRGAIYARVEE